ncbi:MAG TPA: hypothetical protein VKM96_01730 [Candidatus Bathyarchaeia archaeon]|nr:hypothetical protein [Candidatus Bathyarchaeia archaeon]
MSGFIILESLFLIPQSIILQLKEVAVGTEYYGFSLTPSQILVGEGVVEEFAKCLEKRFSSRVKNSIPESTAGGTKSLYRNWAAHLVNEQAAFKRLVDDPTRLAIL